MNYNWNVNSTKFKHDPSIPESFRMLIVGPSGCGKTNLLFNMLLKPGFLDYNNLIVFSKTINQPEYQLLKLGFENSLSKEEISDIFRNQNKYQGKSINEIFENSENKPIQEISISTLFSSKLEQIMPPQSLNKSKKNLIIFDDCVNMKNQSVMEEYFTRGRHQNCNCIYLSQSWYDLPNRSIRNNSNFIILFKLSKRNKDQLYTDLFSNIFEKSEFDSLVSHHWSKKYKYIALNTTTENVIMDLFPV